MFIFITLVFDIFKYVFLINLRVIFINYVKYFLLNSNRLFICQFLVSPESNIISNHSLFNEIVLGIFLILQHFLEMLFTFDTIIETFNPSGILISLLRDINLAGVSNPKAVVANPRSYHRATAGSQFFYEYITYMI